MPKRKTISRKLQCAEKACGEYAFWQFDTRREYDDHERRVREWKCSRHAHPDEVLSVTNLKRVWLSEPALPSETYQNIPRTTLFFGSNGFIFGTGYKAHAQDFPVGTRIRVTAEVLLPTATGLADPSTVASTGSTTKEAVCE